MMRKNGLGLGLSLLALSACGAEDDSMGKSSSEAGRSAGNGGAAATASAGVGAGAGVAAKACEADEPEDTVNVGLAFAGVNDTYGVPPQTFAIHGTVVVERAVPEQLDLVDEEGQRVALFVRGSSSVSFRSIAIGTRFWLSAWERSERPSPFGWLSSSAFSLRTEQGGPVLLAGLEGATDDGGGAMALPVAIQPLCTGEYPLDRGSDRKCVRRVELFEAIVDADPAVHVAPGTRATAQIDGIAYEVGLRYATFETYSDSDPAAGFPCAPADWTPMVRLDLNLVSDRWAELSAKQPVDLAALPACHLGASAPPVSIDITQFDWSQFPDGNAEFSVALASSDDDSLEFSSEYGALRVTGESEALAVLKRASWFSTSDFYTLVLREAADGDALVAYSQTTVGTIKALAQRSDVLGSNIGVEPRCDWLSDACPGDGGAHAIALHDIVYGDGTRVPSHEKDVVSAGTRLFDAWIAVTPSCKADPPATAIFVARDE